MAVFTTRTPAPDPREDGMAEIERWKADRLAAEEAFLATYPDPHLVEAHRAQAVAIVTAHVADLRAALDARTR